jgi:hypothetical protein
MAPPPLASLTRGAPRAAAAWTPPSDRRAARPPIATARAATPRRDAGLARPRACTVLPRGAAGQQPGRARQAGEEVDEAALAVARESLERASTTLNEIMEEVLRDLFVEEVRRAC